MFDEILYTYKGLAYSEEIEYEEDNRKIYHNVYVIDFNGKLNYLTWFPLSPYSSASRQMFINWIDMGMPTREQLGGQQREDHEKYYQKWITLQLEKELDL